MKPNRFVDSGIDFFEFDKEKPGKPSKGYTPEQKKELWNRYAQKTLRQEEVFKKVFDNVFTEQKNQVLSELERTGQLPVSLDDDKTAQKFQPAIELVYHDAFQSAV